MHISRVITILRDESGRQRPTLQNTIDISHDGSCTIWKKKSGVLVKCLLTNT